MAEKLTPAEFWDRCNRAPWFYDYIDNHEAYDRGRRAMAVIRDLSKQSPEHEAIYAAWKERGMARDPKPPRPEESRSKSEPCATCNGSGGGYVLYGSADFGPDFVPCPDCATGAEA